MLQKIKTIHWKKLDFVLIGIMLLAACTRLIGLGNLPDGILPDEAYGAYNAYSLMNEGIDSRGYRFPIYFVAWGSGMNVLYSYLAIPFMRLLGTDIVIYRIPQALVGIASVYVMYELGKDFFHQKMGYLLAFVLAINPWHIMNTRFGLESNLAPGIFIIALYFLVKGVKQSSIYLIPAAFFTGAVLYSYALTWIVVPLFLILALLLYYRQIPKNIHTLLFMGILFIMALPLILFVGINMGLLPEIRTDFFSIPKLPGFRGTELKLANIGESIKLLGNIVLHQYDGKAHTSSELVGAYYFFTTPFIIAGIIGHIISFVKNYRGGDNHLQYVFFIWLISAFVMCILNENITIIHTNLIHIPFIFYGTYGIWKTAELLKNRLMVPICIAFFSMSFVLFYYDYATEPSTYFFNECADEAIEAAKEAAGNETITILGYTTIKYSNLLWHEKPTAEHFYQNVVYAGDPAWAELESYGRFRYVYSTDHALDPGVYIIPTVPSGYSTELRQKGFAIQPVNDSFSLAIKQ